MGSDGTADPIFWAKDRANHPMQSGDSGGNTQTKTLSFDPPPGAPLWRRPRIFFSQVHFLVQELLPPKCLQFCCWFQKSSRKTSKNEPWVYNQRLNPPWRRLSVHIFDDYGPCGKQLATMKHQPVSTAQNWPSAVETVKIRSFAEVGNRGKYKYRNDRNNRKDIRTARDKIDMVTVSCR